MQMNDYQAKAAETAIYSPEVGLLYTTLGLVGEAGELANKLKKVYRDCTAVPNDVMVDELGDVLWYVAMLAKELGTDLDAVARLNVQKLEGRKARNVVKGSGDKR